MIGAKFWSHALKVLRGLRPPRGGDWGQLDNFDMTANAEALKRGSRILSAYVLLTGVKIWIITEAEDDSGKREATTILLPEEY